MLLDAAAHLLVGLADPGCITVIESADLPFARRHDPDQLLRESFRRHTPPRGLRVQIGLVEELIGEGPALLVVDRVQVKKQLPQRRRRVLGPVFGIPIPK
jgi:hypothetical protein